MSSVVLGGFGGLVACVVAYAAHAASLPYQSKDRHLGVASCASSLCHGSVTPNSNYNVLLNEFITWSHQDAHAKAFQALTSERGRSIAAKLGLPSAETAKECLDCHADNVAPAQRGAKFALTDGVGCEACHGGAERWIASHATAKATYQGDVGQGMYPSANLGDRAQLCESCHVGTADKQATHNIMGAGHPRLSFELDTYLALEPPHYAADANYRRRKPAFNHAQTWAAGQLQASAQQLDLLLSSADNAPPVVVVGDRETPSYIMDILARGGRTWAIGWRFDESASLLTRAAGELEDALQAIQSEIDSVAPVTDAARAAPPMDVDRMRNLGEGLMKSLDRGALDDQSLIELTAILGSHVEANRLADLSDAIGDFNFESARTMVAAMLESFSEADGPLPRP